MDERSRESVGQLLERARSEWQGIEFVVYVHPDRLDALADDNDDGRDDAGTSDDPSLRSFNGADLRAWDIGMSNPPAVDEVHVRPFYGQVIPPGIPEYSLMLGRETVC